MTIGIVTNPERDPGGKYAKEVAAWLEARNCKTVFSGDEVYSSKFLIVLGGDGTILRAAPLAARYSTPILGINLGTLGYLTDVDHHEGFSALEKLLAGDFRREQRMMLEAQGIPALNEVLIHRDGTSSPMAFRICVNGNHMDTLRADGVIVASPTGSTAYNLSAGGPILIPDSEMIVVTAVCPHALYARPWVFSGNDEVTLSVESGKMASVALDGEVKFSLGRKEPITVRRSQHTATVVKTSGMDFFEVLRKKMS